MNDIRRVDEAFGVISSYGAAEEVFVNELPHRRSRMLFKYSPPPISQYGNLIYGSVASDGRVDSDSDTAYMSGLSLRAKLLPGAMKPMTILFITVSYSVRGNQEWVGGQALSCPSISVGQIDSCAIN